MRSPPVNAELALLLEVAGTPKPGNVDRERDHPNLRFEHFLAGAVGARGGLAMAADGEGVGEGFERAVAGMSEQRGGNTQFGALLLLSPLVAAAGQGELTPASATDVARATTVDDAAAFYRAFEHVDVFVEDPPDGMDDLDVRHGSEAVPALREAGLTLWDVMGESASEDGIAREWRGDFERTFRAADRIADRSGPVPARAAETYLWLLSRRPDPFVAKRHGMGTARSVMVRAQEAREGGPELIDAFADSLVESGINPGTTADLVAGALFVALERDDVEV